MNDERDLFLFNRLHPGVALRSGCLVGVASLLQKGVALLNVAATDNSIAELEKEANEKRESKRKQNL